MENSVDIAIIGAGPGGLAASETCARFGASVTVIDEQSAPGGQIYRQAPESLRQRAEGFGIAYVDGVAKANAVSSISAIEWRLGHAVWNVLTPQQTQSEAFLISTVSDDGLSEIEAKRVIVATGCYDMPVPFPGWTLPGVMGAGAIQALMKGQRVVPGKKIVLAGSHPLLLIIAEQMLAFGERPAAVVFSQPMWRAGRLLSRPGVAVSFAEPLAQAARAYAKLLRAGVPVIFSGAVLRADGNDRVESVTLAHLNPATGLPQPDNTREISCDAVGIGFGFTASSELVRLAGAATQWSRTGGGWIAVHDAEMRSTVANLYVAGEVAGIGGAKTAAAEGTLAALSALRDAGYGVDAAELRRARSNGRRNRAFAALLQELADPGDELLRALRDEGTVICRCEEITKGQVEELLGQNPFLGTSNALKLLGRTGMGACQGRYCSRSVLELISSATGRGVEDIGQFTARPPVKPVPMHHFGGGVRD